MDKLDEDAKYPNQLHEKRPPSLWISVADRLEVGELSGHITASVSQYVVEISNIVYGAGLRLTSPGLRLPKLS